MANLYTSDLIVVGTETIDFEIDQLTLDQFVSIKVEKYSASDVYIEDIVPDKSYIENGGCTEGKTRIRIFLESGQAEATEKIKVIINDGNE